MSNPLPPGQGPIDPRGAFGPPPGGTGQPLPPRPQPGAGGPAPVYGQGPTYPPGPMMPPPMYWPPPPAPRRGGVGKVILIVFLLIMLGVSVLLNLALLVGNVMGEGAGSIRQKVMAEGDDTQRVAVVPVKGMILDGTAETFDRVLGHVEKDANVKAVVIDVDTPGGSVSASDQIYHRILTFKQARPGVPVVIAQGALATSGGYYVSCAGDWIVAQPTTMTGNIGVIMPRFNLSKLADKWGIEDVSLHSTGSDFKTAGSMFKPESPEEQAYIQGLIDTSFAEFKRVVTTARPKVNFAQVGNGKVFMAPDAKALGLIDDIGYRDKAWKKAAASAATPLTRPKVVQYDDMPGLLDLLTAKSALGEGRAKGVTVNGVSVDGKTVAEWLSPRMMYLWTGR